jgi:hypothetical protein
MMCWSMTAESIMVVGDAVEQGLQVVGAALGASPRPGRQPL